MPTKYNLNIDTRSNESDPSGDGVMQNTTIRSEDPNELIAILQKLSGMSPAHAHEEPVAAPVVKVAAQELPSGAMRAIMQKSGLGALPEYEHAEEASCGAVMEEQVEEALANAPKPKTMKNLLDIVNTDHTASTPNKVTKAGHGDNPLPKSEDDLMEDRLMQEWKATKIQHYADELDMSAVGRAISEGAKSFIDGSREYAVRNQDGFIKVYPVIENRVMTQSPVYVVQEAFSDMKHLVGDTGPGKGRGVSLDLSRDNRFSPDKLAALDVPAAQRAGMGPAAHPEKLSHGTHGRGRPMPVAEQEGEELSLRDMWNRYARHYGTEKDAQEDSEARARAKHEALQVVIAVTDAHGPEAAADMKRYAQHKLAYDNTGNRRHDDAALELLDKYSLSMTASNVEDEIDEPAPKEYKGSKEAEEAGYYGPHDERTPALLRRQATESVNEAKKKKAKNKYAIGMAAAMKATGDKPPLEKSTITKAHKIADKIKEGSKKK